MRLSTWHDVVLRWRDAHPCDATSPRCASPHGMTWHGMACTLGSPYGGAHGGDVTHEGNRGAVPPLCAATSRANTVLNTGRHLKSAERLRGRGCMIRMCNTIIRMASFVQPPRQGRGPASGGEGTAERMCGVWGDATVARMLPRGRPPVVRVVPGRVRSLPVCFSSPLDAVRAACGLKAKRRGVEGRSSIASAVWNGSLHRFDRALWSLHGPPAGRCGALPAPGVHLATEIYLPR